MDNFASSNCHEFSSVVIVFFSLSLSLGGVWLKDDTGERVVNDGAELPKACRGATPVSPCKAETGLG